MNLAQRFLLHRIRILPEMTMEAYFQRAKLANEKIHTLRNLVAKIKETAIAAAIKEKETKLELENQRLLERVNELKKQLLEAEMMNGKMQVPLPTCDKKQSVPGELKQETEPVKKKQKTEKAKKKMAPPKPKNTEGAPVDVSRLDFRVALIVKAEKHPDADSLYVEEIETGEETNRTVISGLVQHVPIEEMQNRMVVLMMNLKPVKMRGIMSHAMVMCASSPDKVEILIPPPGSVPGDRVTVEGFPGEPDAQLNPKKKVWEQVQPDLRTDENKVACYKGVPFTVIGKGVCVAPTMSNSEIR